MPLSRRQVLTVPAALAITPTLPAAEKKPPQFGFCLNTSTVRLPEGAWGKPRGIVELIDIASRAGYQAIEPWISELQAYIQGGGTAAELRKRFADANLKVPDCIGFAEWLPDDEARRVKGLDQAKRDLELVATVGGERLAAPPVGATGGGSRRDDAKSSPPVSLLTAAQRYRTLLELGKSFGVTPIVEVWGHSQCLSRLGETLMVASECGLPGGAILPDVYHLYKGGSEFTGLGLVHGAGIGIFHVNDYPAIERGKIVDQDRVFPGDGVAPLQQLFRTLQQIGYSGYLSLELFNRSYWQRDPHAVAREGLQKLQSLLS